MALADAVQGARRRGQAITWLNADGEPVDLTGLSLTGRLRSYATGDQRDVDGELEVTNPSAGEFTWAYGVNDVGDAGTFQVQFIGTDGEGLQEKTFLADWVVAPALAG